MSKDHAFYQGLAAVKKPAVGFVKSTRRVQQNARLGTAKVSVLDAIDYRNAFN